MSVKNKNKQKQPKTKSQQNKIIYTKLKQQQNTKQRNSAVDLDAPEVPP